MIPAETHDAQADQQKQPILGRVFHEQLKQLSPCLVFGNDLGIGLTPKHPDFKQDDDHTHIAAASDVRVVQIVIFVFAEFIKPENLRKGSTYFLHDTTPVRICHQNYEMRIAVQTVQGFFILICKNVQ